MKHLKHLEVLNKSNSIGRLNNIQFTRFVFDEVKLIQLSDFR